MLTNGASKKERSYKDKTNPAPSFEGAHMRQKRLMSSRQSMCVYALLTSTCTTCNAPARTQINAFCLLHYFNGHESFCAYTCKLA